MGGRMGGVIKFLSDWVGFDKRHFGAVGGSGPVMEGAVGSGGGLNNVYLMKDLYSLAFSPRGI